VESIGSWGKDFDQPGGKGEKLKEDEEKENAKKNHHHYGMGSMGFGVRGSVHQRLNSP